MRLRILPLSSAFPVTASPLTSEVMGFQKTNKGKRENKGITDYIRHDRSGFANGQDGGLIRP